MRRTAAIGAVEYKLDRMKEGREVSVLERTRERVFLVIRNLRRALAKAIEPPDPEKDKKWEVPIELSLKGAKALREKLPIDEDGYLFVAGPAWGDCRAYVLYTALDEVKKCAIYLMRLRELLDGPPVSPRDDRVSRLMFSQLLEEQNARKRRLIELLVTLVLFETTNSQEFYRDLLLLEDLDDLLSSNADLEEFYGARSANIDNSVAQRLADIRRIEGSVDLSKAWYRAQLAPLPQQDRLRPGRLLSSVRSRVRAALPLMAARERLLVGFSYAGYGQASESIHYSTNPRDYRLRQGQAQAKALNLGLINFAILDRCHRLLGRPDVPIITRLSDSLERTEPSELVHRATVRDITAGDFVLAYGNLAEVMEIRGSPYGYRSYRVRYLAEKPIPAIQEDWFPAFYVQLFCTRERFLKRMQEMVAQGRMPADAAEMMGRLTDAQLQPLIRASLTDTWKLGLREWVRGEQRKAQEKQAKNHAV
jgi:hypothetical protein